MRLRYTTEDEKVHYISVNDVKRIDDFHWKVLNSSDKEHEYITIRLIDFFKWVIYLDEERYTITNDASLYKLVVLADALGKWKSMSDNISFYVYGERISRWCAIDSNTGGMVEIWF